MSTPKSISFSLAFMVLLLSACGTLDPAGPYAGDKILYEADQTIATSYAFLDTFVTWEKANAAGLTAQPAIHQAAEKIRREAPEWFKSAVTLRDVYAREPTPANRQSLAAILGVIQAALVEATHYLLAGKHPIPTPT